MTNVSNKYSDSPYYLFFLIIIWYHKYIYIYMNEYMGRLFKDCIVQLFKYMQEQVMYTLHYKLHLAQWTNF